MFSRTEHVKFFMTCLDGLPADYVELDTQRMVLLYFCVLGLDILGALHEITNDQIENVVRFVDNNRLQLQHPTSKLSYQGYHGSGFIGSIENLNGSMFVQTHLAMTYSALAILSALGRSIQTSVRDEILSGIALCQQPDGSFSTSCDSKESDVRFCYCACVIVSLLHPGVPSTSIDYRSYINVELLTEYVMNCFTFEGGFSLTPGIFSVCSDIMQMLYC
jgi:geranylgeranyl transferase type-1 subunit beta